MSHRVEDLEHKSPVGRFIAKLRYKEIYRQGTGIILLMLFAWFAVPVQPLATIGTVLILVGASVRFWAAGMVMKNKILATSGPYAWVRHPLYVGNILILVGMAMLANQLWIYATTLFFFWFFYPPAIRYEDGKLLKIFNSDWKRWASQVPALIPRFSPYPQRSSDNWSLKRAVGRNGELYILLWVVASVILACYF